MNKQDFNKAIEKGVTCAITALLIIFCGLFIFYAGYKFGRERVLDSNNSEIVSTQSLSVSSTYLNDYSTPIFDFPIPVIDTNNYKFTACTVYRCSFSFKYNNSGNIDIIFSTYGVSGYWDAWSSLTPAIVNGSSSGAVYYSGSGIFNSFNDIYQRNYHISNSSNSFRFENDFLTSAGTYSVNGEIHIDGFNSSFTNYSLSRIVFTRTTDSSRLGSYNSCDIRVYNSNDDYFTIYSIYSPTVNTASFKSAISSFSSGLIYYLDYSDNTFYQSGFDTGYTDGYNAGSSNGYSDGYNNGSNIGYSNGYNDGINVTNTYSFSNLLTAVVDAPVHVFINLLDFEIMGFNLLSLVTGLLTFAFIILVIKLILGGK